MKVIQRTGAANTSGDGNNRVTMIIEMPMPSRFTMMTKVVRITWMRTLRRRWLSDTRPNTHDPYSGVVGIRLFWRVTPSRTRPSRRASDLSEFIVASA
ncbi:hypothetical protein ATO49_20465 [Mycolicibacterium fortuitum subsp. fortuitum DSM 46621 = ATCC 6841 = JCM 6387]|nr:hypothetical protein ATO49_20465 [Mycolicibacterium fortuitum subsp. fortuitum DSM 46621 = ATCC 6841 = JCM 6387]